VIPVLEVEQLPQAYDSAACGTTHQYSELLRNGRKPHLNDHERELEARVGALTNGTWVKTRFLYAQFVGKEACAG